MKSSWKIILLVFGLALWTTSCGSGSDSSSNLTSTGMFGSSGQVAPVAGNLQPAIQALQNVGIVFVLVQTPSGLVPEVDVNTFMTRYPGLSGASGALQYFVQLASQYLQQMQYSGQVNTTTFVYTQTELQICNWILSGAVN